MDEQPTEPRPAPTEPDAEAAPSTEPAARAESAPNTPSEPAATRLPIPTVYSGPYVSGVPVQPKPPPQPTLAGEARPLAKHPFAIVEALLKAPASVLYEIRSGRGVAKLVALVFTTMLLTGLTVGAFSGGWQLLLVPVKVACGMLFCALICLPSLYIFSALSGAEQSLRETWGALLMGIALVGVLLVGLAPVSWVFSQATSSSAFMGALHLAFLLLSLAFGVGLIRRVLAAANRRPVSGLTLWGLVFVLVMLQMTTSLRPLVGPYEGELVASKMFFLAHWFQVLSAS